jgi:hypothetical protein
MPRPSARRWKAGEALAFLSEPNIHPGVDRVVAVFPDGRAFAWHQLNQRDLPADCPPGPRTELMPDLLIELFSEEIPARMQGRAREDLKKLVTDGLVEAGLTYASAGAFSTPRRLVLAVEGLTAESARCARNARGRTSAPAAALEGFLRSTGLTLDQLERRADKKGEVFYRRGRKARPQGGGHRGRGAGSRDPQFPLAEVDALGRGVACAGCGRCSRSSACCRMRPAPMSCRWRSTGSLPAT